MQPLHVGQLSVEAWVCRAAPIRLRLLAATWQVATRVAPEPKRAGGAVGSAAQGEGVL